jgi:hypothetical protein
MVKMQTPKLKIGILGLTFYDSRNANYMPHLQKISCLMIYIYIYQTSAAASSSKD